MRKLIFVAVCVLGAAAGTLRAQDKDPQLENIKTLRANVMAKLPGLVDLFDYEHNGINAAANALTKQYQDSIANVNKQIETENAKPADARDKAAVDALTAKSTRFQVLWNERAQTSGPAWGQKFNALSTARVNLVTLVNDLTNMDQVWLRADCDRALLVANFTELNKRLDEIKEQASALITEWLKKTADDAHILQE